MSTQTFGKSNYRLIIIGIVLVLLGYVLMIGGGSENPNVFNYEIFGFRRLTLAPIIIVGGIVLIGWGIMKKAKDQ